MDPRNLLTLQVGGNAYGGWKAVNVRTSIEQLAGNYELSVTEKWPHQTKEWVIPPGELCQVAIGDDVLITGYVDAVNVSYDSGSHEIKVTGRDKAGDLVDCSAPSTGFAGQTFEQIARALCKPFGIAVYDETVSGKKVTVAEQQLNPKGMQPKNPRNATVLAKQTCQNGETVFRTLDRIARNEGVLLISDGQGGLLITRAGMGGRTDAELRRGHNILRASIETNHSALFSEITVKGQSAAPAAEKYDVSHTSAKATVTRAKVAKTGNSQIARYRPLIVVAESQADGHRCQQRAEWEASNREARAQKISITVQGWRQGGTGDLWRINILVKVVCDWMRVDGWWLISSINYKLDEGGTTAELSLVNQNAFTALPEIPAPAQGAKANKYKV